MKENMGIYLYCGLVSFLAHPGNKILAGTSIDKVLESYAKIALRAKEVYELQEIERVRSMGSVSENAGVEDCETEGSFGGERSTVGERDTRSEVGSRGLVGLTRGQGALRI